ncbi:protein RETICULATA-RELATED 4, chloroplastic-like [Malania oleifera]|uniref:protein RETICULATA-RELATED 4, chloroplastic-like n=1 Tax=Malania oleifera TaxID=397392 RepID=UPI0025AE7303|nr:protein RETICULATA-RELATED 4, chloroplastic-like [Malania oleifera]XP_057977522.1 protein RETICULATA-RELATED 4, chloroplastic-like [Malania oleifera]XP_057977523.1 protein RETICULATA-RELATED 4, chloroplastic-like [Malania oleifera]
MEERERGGEGEGEREREDEERENQFRASMVITACSNLATRALSPPPLNLHHSSLYSFALIPCRHLSFAPARSPHPSFTSSSARSRRSSATAAAAAAGDGGGGGGARGGSGGGSGGGDEDAGDRNKEEAVLALAEIGRSLDSLPKDLAAAIEAGRVPGLIVRRYFELEKSAIFRWLLRFGGFKERLLADDLFLAKVAMECGVGIFTKTAAELERRRENFTKELDFVFADVVMAIIADFMLVWLPAPTVSLRPPLAISAGPLAKFFYGCPENAFQVALAGTSYSFLQRIGAIVRNGAKLFAVGTGASLVGTGLTDALINARKAVDKSFAVEAEDVPILSTSIAYGVYMAVSSNLRYQVLAGIIEQRVLEPLLHQHKIVLSAICFAVRTGNTFLGSLMWVDYARWTGIQKIRD